MRRSGAGAEDVAILLAALLSAGRAGVEGAHPGLQQCALVTGGNPVRPQDRELVTAVRLAQAAHDVAAGVGLGEDRGGENKRKHSEWAKHRTPSADRERPALAPLAPSVIVSV